MKNKKCLFCGKKEMIPARKGEVDYFRCSNCGAIRRPTKIEVKIPEGESKPIGW